MSATTSSCGERRRRAPRIAGVCLALAGGLCGPPAGAAEPTLAVQVLDHGTGRAIPDPQCALVEPAGRTVRARFTGATYQGSAAPRAGDELFVYRRGYDLARVLLAEGQRTATARLRPARDGVLVLRNRREGDPEIAVAVVTKMPRDWGETPVRDSYRSALRDGRLTLPIARGLRTFVVLAPDRRHVVWPPLFTVTGGETYEVTLDRPRRIRVERDWEALPVYAGRLAFLPDILWKPPLAATRIDAWRLYTGQISWLEADLVAGRAYLDVLPNAPFHFFGHLEGRPVYRYVGRGDDVLDLRRPFPLKAVTARPVVDRAPVPAGTVIAPGRLDLLTVTNLWSERHRLEGCLFRTAPRAQGWPDVRLAPADWLTIWHEDLGLAHVRWEEGQPPAGTTYPGRLTVTLPAGFTATGYVSAYPVWKGTGQLRSVPSEELLRRHFDGRRELRFPGLRPAQYGLCIRVVLTERRTGRTFPLQHRLEVPVTLPHLSATYRIPLHPE
ncbi:MAG: hypothetical protein ACYTFD_01025 [Planctomycetota bacterium]